MKKKFIRVMFFGALALTTFSYVGCKDYDDDIDRLEQKITENANAIAEINKLIEGGSAVSYTHLDVYKRQPLIPVGRDIPERVHFAFCGLHLDKTGAVPHFLQRP